ncbi:putative serine protease [Ixodes scapularis]
MPFIEGSGWPDRKCGRSLVRSRGRFIYDGRQAKNGQFPWMVSLGMVLANGSGRGCGGSIIKEDVVLTAAHCLPEGLDTSESILVAGTSIVFLPILYYQERKIKQVIIHEDYWGDVMPDASHDIALIKLTRPFDFAASKGHIGTVCLAVMPPRPGNVVTVTGWGEIYPNGSSSFILLAATVPVMKDKICKNMYLYLYRPKMMFCAGENETNAGRGDSGGPAVFRSGRKSFQVGIVSFGSFENPYHATVYTKVSSHIKWIAHTLKKLE